jgi:hypothetical protein
MTADANQQQDQSILFNTVQNNHIAPDMTVSQAFQIAFQRMIPVLGWKWFAFGKEVDHFFNFRSDLGQRSQKFLEVFLEGPSEFDFEPGSRQLLFAF